MSGVFVLRYELFLQLGDRAVGFLPFLERLTVPAFFAFDRRNALAFESPGVHTFSIEITHERGPGTDGSWVWIDGVRHRRARPSPAA